MGLWCYFVGFEHRSAAEEHGDVVRHQLVGEVAVLHSVHRLHEDVVELGPGGHLENRGTQRGVNSARAAAGARRGGGKGARALPSAGTSYDGTVAIQSTHVEPRLGSYT